MIARHPRALVLGAAVIGLLAGCGTQTGTATGSQTTTQDSIVTRSSVATAPSVSPPSVSSPVAVPAGSVSCDFTPDQPAPAGHDVGRPPASAPKAGTASVTLHTSQGDIPITLPRAAAPCTVSSFAFLAAKGFYNKTPCHRLTAAASLKVLQCGDPTGSGTGGPGYTIPDENPTNLRAVPGGQGADVYPRGTVAMANTGQPHSGGSQFFLVYADSMLPPSYAVFGQVSAAGLAVLDKIAAGGVQNDDGNHDGKPAIPVTITSALVAG